MLDFATQNAQNIKIDGIDISSQQYPSTHPSNLHFSVGSVTDLPAEWTNTFAFAHQRLPVGGLTASMWNAAIAEIYRVLTPGAWVELVEAEADPRHFAVGPHSTKAVSVIRMFSESRGVIMDLQAHLPLLLQDAGFVDVHYEPRNVPLRRSI